VGNQAILLVAGRVSSDDIDGTPTGDLEEPCTRTLGHAFVRPLRERRDERVLSDLLSEIGVAGDPGGGGDEAWELEPPEGVESFAVEGGGQV